MNLNSFVVLPNNKAKSVKLNARNLQNLQQLQMETVSLAQESEEMEVKLQQLKETTSKEKEERGHSRGFSWKFGKGGNAVSSSTKKNKEEILQKLSAGRVKIRVLKDEPLTASPPSLPPPMASSTSVRTVRKNRLRGTICGQCEVKTAGLMCTECTENYCIGCFARFHQKGALKFHRMIPIQTDLQTHVSTPDVINSFQKLKEHSLLPGTFTDLVPSPNNNPRCNPHPNFTYIKGNQSPEEEDVSQDMPVHPDPSQVLLMSVVEDKNIEVNEEGLKMKNEEDFSESLLRGQFDEEESARSFQEALKQWKGEKSHPTVEPTYGGGIWKPIVPVSVSATATQVDLHTDREDEEEQTGQVGRTPVTVTFMENSLTYMDRLLLKEHRRKPIQQNHASLDIWKDLKSNKYAEDETTNSITALEEDFRQYCASLFAVHVSRGRTEPQLTTPESCLVIEVLDETQRENNGTYAAVQTTDYHEQVPSVQWVSNKDGTLVPQPSFTSGRSSNVSLSASTSPQQSSQSRIAALTTAAQSHNPFKPQTSEAEHLLTLMSSKSNPPACPTVETPRTSKTLIRTPVSKLQKLNFPPTVEKTKADLGSSPPPLTRTLPDCQSKIIKVVQAPPSFSPGISPVYLDSSLHTLEKSDSSTLLPEEIPATKLSQLTLTNLENSTQSQHSFCVSASTSQAKQLQHPLSPVSYEQHPQHKNLELDTQSDLPQFNETSLYEDASVFMPFIPIAADHEPTRSRQFLPSTSAQFLNNNQLPTSAVKIDDALSVDSADEISIDSLGLGSHEEDSSDEEEKIHRRIMRGRSRGEEQGNTAISHLEDFFVPADAEQEEDLLSDETVQLPEPSMVLHNQSAGSGLELFCDLHGFMPLGLDVNSVQSDTPEHTHCDPLHASQTSSHILDPLVSEDHGAGSSLEAYTEEHLVYKMMDNVLCSSTHTGGRQISTNELRTSGSIWSGKFTPTLSQPTLTTSSLLPASVRSSLSCFPSPPFGLSHPTSELGPVLCPLSQAAQEIMAISSVDQTGCEDPDLDNATIAHTIHNLEQELRLMAKEIGVQSSVFHMGNSESQDQPSNQHINRSRLENDEEEEETTQRDQQSVLLLP